MLTGNVVTSSLEEGSNGQGIFGFLPEGIANVLNEIDSTMSEILAENLAENPLTSILINNPMLILIIFFVVTVSISLFINFVQDVWKMPIAVILDVLVLTQIPNITFLSFIAGIGGFLFFLVLFSDLEKLRWVFGLLCLLNAILPLSMFSMVPLTTTFGLVAAFMTR